ncbi:methionine/alanine import family NSS transporter small subunit [Canibacter sp. lx-72]|uniref:methionine/alanine import family NSS transporter small subunit n=1 Tax=Canibacter zhuwentaonis TaxID=2837491 RepID=UPI001BDCE3FA|nr:methionine/alanine import family NSS transporter small subunit [Canibacter zhuwentaonis]MBT1018567.1 methionine/alanine import family NSS transporter small subunit [Canibacter zhuwentaonis]MBT1035762.1 methionine/alanine import family NSS transporter small subunit [Canibacter zhuwentaonis]MBT1035965.1 methionine/alanine import family NSS transporter small subunit [Canibacter zhuwentaonis]
MTAPAIIMLVVTLVIVWGGLAASVVALRFLPIPEATEEDSTSAAHKSHVTE